MNTITDKKHIVQKHILSQLLEQKFSRFRDLRPKYVDTNLFNYHLKSLITQGLVYKADDGYSLSDVTSVKLVQHTIQSQIACVVQNSSGDILLRRRTAQPFADCYELPGEHLDSTQSTTVAAALLFAQKELSNSDIAITHAGDCYIRVRNDNEVLFTQFMHIFRFETEDVYDRPSLVWVRPHKLSQYELAPCVEQIMTRTFFKDDHFFEEFEETW